MARKKKTYRRLPGNIWTRKYRFFNYERSSLWAGPDHVLHVQSTSFTEKYKRFYFEDIQAIVISRTATRRNANLVLGTVAGIFAALALAIWLYLPRPAIFGAGFLGIQGGMFLLLMLFNTLLGPACVCRLYTAVQVEELGCLGRIRTAKKALRILRPLIESAQGAFTAETPEIPDAPATVEASPHALADLAPAARQQTIRHDNGAIHLAMFGWLILCSISYATEQLFAGTAKNIVDILLSLGLIILIVLALRRQSGSDLPGRVKTITWVALTIQFLAFFFASTYGTIYAMQHIEEIPPMASPLGFHLDGPIYRGFCVTMAFLHAVLAVTGLILVGRHRQNAEDHIPPPIAEIVPNKES
jgi:hypothetical protein